MTVFSYLAAAALVLLAPSVSAQLGEERPIREERTETLCLVEETGLLNRQCPDGMDAEGYFREVRARDVELAAQCGSGGSVGPVVANGDWLFQDQQFTYGTGEAGSVRGRSALGTQFPNDAQRFDVLLRGDDLVKMSVKDFGSISFDAFVNEPGQWTMYLYLVNTAVSDLEASPDFYADCVIAYTPRNPLIGEWQTLTIDPDTLGSQFFHESETGCFHSRLSGYPEEWVIYSGLKGAECPLGVGFSVLAGEDKEAYIDNVVIKNKDGMATIYDFEQ